MEQTIPVPRARQTVRITQHGGYNWRCPAAANLAGTSLYNGWCAERDGVDQYRSTCGAYHDDSDTECRHPRADAEVVEAAPKVIEGRVTRTGRSIQGVPLVYVKVEGERYAEIIAWNHRVLGCEVLA